MQKEIKQYSAKDVVSHVFSCILQFSLSPFLSNAFHSGNSF